MNLAHPAILALLIALPALGWLGVFLRRTAVAPISSTRALEGAPRTWRLTLRWLPSGLRLAALALVVGALARPQESTGWTTTSTEGIAIQIVFDRSGSMRESIGGEGGDTPKIDIARKTVADFIHGDGRKLKGRSGDMIGLIAFARYADTLSPLARAHEAVVEAANRIQPAEVRAEDGTAIGDALALAAARLKRAEEDDSRHNPADGSKPEYSIKSKAIILMTDGENNAGEVSPYEAATQAKEWGIHVYTIGVGAGERFVTMNTPFGTQRMPMGSDVDERMLKSIAETTGGAYFSAGSPDALASAYAAIDSLERSRIDATQHSAHRELFMPLAVSALAVLALELALSCTVLRRVA